MTSATRISTVIAVLMTVLSPPAIDASQDGTVTRNKAALAQIQQVLAEAWVKGDRRTLERIIAPEWRSTGPNGRLSDRITVLADVFETRVHRIHSLEIDDVNVELFDNVAVIRGRTHGVGEFAGAPYDVVIRFTDTFVRRNAEWQAVASHSSLDAGR